MFIFKLSDIIIIDLTFSPHVQDIFSLDIQLDSSIVGD